MARIDEKIYERCRRQFGCCFGRLFHPDTNNVYWRSNLVEILRRSVTYDQRMKIGPGGLYMVKVFRMISSIFSDLRGAFQSVDKVENINNLELDSKYRRRVTIFQLTERENLVVCRFESCTRYFVSTSASPLEPSRDEMSNAVTSPSSSPQLKHKRGPT